jgi:hypothetical protein
MKTQEASSGVITLPAHERCQVEKMVDFLYTSSYDASGLPDHVKAYITGVRYQIEALEEYASDRVQIVTKHTFGMGFAWPPAPAIAMAIELLTDAALPAKHDGLEKRLKSHIVLRLKELYRSQEFVAAMRRCHMFQSDIVEAFFGVGDIPAIPTGTFRPIEAAPGAEAVQKTGNTEGAPKTT